MLSKLWVCSIPYDAMDRMPQPRTINHLSLSPRPPFRLDLTVWVLRRIVKNEIDQWDGKIYRRALIIDGCPVEVEVTQQGRSTAPELSVTMRSSKRINTDTAAETLSTMLGLRADLSAFYEMTRKDPVLASLTNPFIGMRPTRFPTLFEAVLNGVSCQQLSLQAGLQILSRLTRIFGQQIGDLHAFPNPADLASALPADIKALGFSLRKAETVVTMARSITSGVIDLEGLCEMEDEQIVSRLSGVPGIGRWTAEYVLLRGMGRLHSFPGDDVGGAGKLQRWLSLEKRPTYVDVRKLLARWHPYQGLIYFHLVLRNLQEKGVIGD
jgi:DNA-3-methyladenine glycosylase II